MKKTQGKNLIKLVRFSSFIINNVIINWAVAWIFSRMKKNPKWFCLQDIFTILWHCRYCSSIRMPSSSKLVFTAFMWIELQTVDQILNPFKPIFLQLFCLFQVCSKIKHFNFRGSTYVYVYSIKWCYKYMLDQWFLNYGSSQKIVDLKGFAVCLNGVWRSYIQCKNFHLTKIWKNLLDKMKWKSKCAV